MSLHEYKTSEAISREHPPFYALIMAAMREAGSANIELLCSAWPEVWAELQARYNAPGGVLPEDDYQGEWPPPELTVGGLRRCR